MSVLIFYVTHADEASANLLVEKLLQQRLIACGNCFPISAAYAWEGQFLTGQAEWVSLLKTRPELELMVENAIQMVHPYETPCILRWLVTANASYEAWIHQETTPLP